MARSNANRRAQSKLWACAKCRRRFANRNQSHFCGSTRPLQEHFRGKPRSVRALFNSVRSAVEACGPVQVLSEKSRIAFHVRMSFMAICVQRNGLRGHFVFATLHEHPRFLRVDAISRRNHVHHFRVAGPEDIDSKFNEWVAEAYRVGQQRHLARPAKAE
jgi:hypothetical protein